MLKLTDHQERVGSNSLTQNGRAACSPQGWTDLDQVSVPDAQFGRRASVDNDPFVPFEIIGYLFDNLHADVTTPGVLHAARSQQPKRKRFILPTQFVEDSLSDHIWEVMPDRERFVLSKLFVPPLNALFVQAIA